MREALEHEWRERRRPRDHAGSRMRRVVHVISTPEGLGGAERALRDLVAASASRGWQSSVLNPFSLDPSGSALRAAVEPAYYAGRRCITLPGVLGTRRWLGSEIKRLQPDVVHVHLFHASVMTASLGVSSWAPVVLSHQHGDHFERTDQRLLEGLDLVATRRATVVVGCSKMVTDFVSDRYRLKSDRAMTIHNGWSGTPPTPAPRDYRPPSVVCVARLREQKGHAVLLRAFADVVSRLPEARLTLVGDGPLYGELVSLVDQLGLSTSVEFRGTTEDAWSALAEADVFALASNYEPLGIVLLEAMAAGLPVVATDVGGIPEIVRDGKEGRLVVAGDAGAFGRAMTELLVMNDEARDAMSAAGRHRAANFHSGLTADSYFELYEDLHAQRLSSL